MPAHHNHLSFGLVDGRPLFMDERGDCYFLLEGELEASFLNLIASPDPDPVIAPDLREALGLADDCCSIPAAHCERPRRSLVAKGGSRRRASLGDALSVATVLLRARRSLTKRPIGAILADLGEADRTCRGEFRHEQLIDRARRFLAARPLVPIKPNCLLDSLSLLSWLGEVRCGVMLVFGAKLDPFAAHCWVQAGDLILNDAVDQAERFTPVRVLPCSAATP